MTSPAAKALRDSINALPEYLAVGPTWTATDGAVIECGPTGYLSIDGETIEQAAAEHIALTASPDVVEFQAQLLDAIRRDVPFESVDDMERWTLAVQDAAHALEAAILHTTTEAT